MFPLKCCEVLANEVVTADDVFPGEANSDDTLAIHRLTIPSMITCDLHQEVTHRSRIERSFCFWTGRSFVAMETLILIFLEETFYVSLLSLQESCDAPGLFVVTSSRVRSSAPAPIVRSFVEALNGTDIKITNENVLYLSRLCSEFGFGGYRRRFRISAILLSIRSGY